MKAGLTGTHLWLKGGSRRQSRRRDKLRNFDWLGGGGGGLHLRQNHSRLWIRAADGPRACAAGTPLRRYTTSPAEAFTRTSTAGTPFHRHTSRCDTVTATRLLPVHWCTYHTAIVPTAVKPLHHRVCFCYIEAPAAVTLLHPPRFYCNALTCFLVLPVRSLCCHVACTL